MVVQKKKRKRGGEGRWVRGVNVEVENQVAYGQ